MKQYKRVIILVLDSVGVGALPDAELYGDQAANTLANIAKALNGLALPNLQTMGLGNIITVCGLLPTKQPTAHYGKMAEMSVGKDTTTGHWEIAGVHTNIPFNVYPEGFPESVIETFTRKINRQILANKPASGTEIIEEYGQQHMETGYPIIYTSADSVFQVAAHEEIIPLDELYEICRVAREIMQGEHAVARIIARPFKGKPGSFYRTANRKDYSVSPPQPTILDYLTEAGISVTGIGKIYDIFNGQGITRTFKSISNLNGLEILTNVLQEQESEGLIFVNLVDFDMLYGHRNDPVGYGKALEEVDAYLPQLIAHMQDTDVLIITADHGCDPTVAGTDHTREYVPLLVYRHGIEQGISLGTRGTFADIAATIADMFAVPFQVKGDSFYKHL